jgi:catechol 2,3-dioxygenase-like lactoylglutathione lyase family enzyme
LPTTPFTAIDHVQLAMPRGEEEKARAFYRDLLGMIEVPKPLELAKRGGCWFASGGVQVHLGVEKDFRPAKKAHPALRCRDYDALLVHLRAAKVEVKEDENIPGTRRCHVFDPFGNRLEMIADSSEPSAG